MKTICLVHGVGFFRDIGTSSIASFADELASRTNATCVISKWDHPGRYPDDSRNTFLFKQMRNMTFEVIMDFAYVVENADTIASMLPAADMYVGHSAGGVIVASRMVKPMVLFGCPAQLLKNTKLQAQQVNTLNIMHYRDPIAATLDGATNVIVTSPRLSPYYNPVSAHIGYWESETVLEMTANWFNSKVGLWPIVA